MHLTVQPKEGGTNISAGAETRVLTPFVQAFMSAEWIGTDPPGDKNHGRLVARDPVTGKIAWEKRYDLIPHSTLLTTASDLLFLGTADGFIEALDARNGQLLWRFNVGSGVHGGIISYAVNGKQYIAAATGHGTYVGRAVQSLNKDKIIIDFQMLRGISQRRLMKVEIDVGPDREDAFPAKCETSTEYRQAGAAGQSQIWDGTTETVNCQMKEVR